MGQAKARGTREQRVLEGIAKNELLVQDRLRKFEEAKKVEAERRRSLTEAQAEQEKLQRQKFLEMTAMITGMGFSQTLRGNGSLSESLASVINMAATSSLAEF